MVHSCGADDRRNLDVLGGRLGAIQHVGTTAVPGRLAKPISDIAAQLLLDVGREDVIERLQTVGCNLTGDDKGFTTKACGLSATALGLCVVAGGFVNTKTDAELRAVSTLGSLPFNGILDLASN